MKKPPTLQLEYVPGDQFPDLASAKRAALPALADHLGAVIQDLLERGELVNVGGTIVPNRRQAPRPTSCYRSNSNPIPRMMFL